MLFGGAVFFLVVLCCLFGCWFGVFCDVGGVLFVGGGWIGLGFGFFFGVGVLVLGVGGGIWVAGCCCFMGWLGLGLCVWFGWFVYFEFWCCQVCGGLLVMCFGGVVVFLFLLWGGLMGVLGLWFFVVVCIWGWCLGGDLLVVVFLVGGLGGFFV